MRASEGILDAIPLDMFFAAMATRIDGPRAARNDRVFNFVFTDVGETHVIELSNGGSCTITAGGRPGRMRMRQSS